GHVVAREGRSAVGPGLDDVADDRLVEGAGGEDSRIDDVALERQVDVGRLVGIELRIAQLDFLVVAVDAGARRDVAEGRARDGAGDRAAHHPVAVGVVAQVQAGQHTGVGARRGAGAGGKLAVLVDLDPPAAGVEVGALHARAGDHAQVAEVHRRHQVAGQHVLAGAVVFDQRDHGVLGDVLRARGEAAPVRGQPAAHGVRGHAVAETAVAIGGRARGPVGEFDVGADAVLGLVHVDVAVAPAAQQARLPGYRFAAVGEVELRAQRFVGDLLGRHHQAVETVAGVAQPGIAPGRVEHLERRHRSRADADRHIVLAQVFEAHLHLVVHALADLGPAELVVEARIAAAIAAAGADGEGVLGLGAVAQAAAEIVGRNALHRPAVAVVARDVAFADRDDVVLAGLGIGEVGVQRAQV